MSDSEAPEEHEFAEPEEALRYFTPEAMAAARPRSLTIDADGRRAPDGDDHDTASGKASPPA